MHKHAGACALDQTFIGCCVNSGDSFENLGRGVGIFGRAICLGLHSHFLTIGLKFGM